MSDDLRELRDRPFELITRLEAMIRSARTDMVAGREQFWLGLGFRVGEHWFVVPKDEVSEVVSPPGLTRVPGARPWLLGVANFRGSLLPVCDLSRLLGFSHDRLSPLARVMVFNSDRIPFGFLVDEVAGHRQFTPGEQRHAMVDEHRELTDFLIGAFVREGQPWLALSLNRAIESDAFKHVGW